MFNAEERHYGKAWSGAMKKRRREENMSEDLWIPGHAGEGHGYGSASSSSAALAHDFKVQGEAIPGQAGYWNGSK